MAGPCVCVCGPSPPAPPRRFRTQTRALVASTGCGPFLGPLSVRCRRGRPLTESPPTTILGPSPGLVFSASRKTVSPRTGGRMVGARGSHETSRRPPGEMPRSPPRSFLDAPPALVQPPRGPQRTIKPFLPDNLGPSPVPRPRGPPHDSPWKVGQPQPSTFGRRLAPVVGNAASRWLAHSCTRTRVVLSRLGPPGTCRDAATDLPCPVGL